MHIGVLTHNYPRYTGDFSGTFVEALCDELARQGHRVTVWAPYDPAYARSLTYTPAAAGVFHSSGARSLTLSTFFAVKLSRKTGSDAYNPTHTGGK
mgnify:CR=1 FL=1